MTTPKGVHFSSKSRFFIGNAKLGQGATAYVYIGQERLEGSDEIRWLAVKQRFERTFTTWPELEILDAFPQHPHIIFPVARWCFVPNEPDRYAMEFLPLHCDSLLKCTTHLDEGLVREFARQLLLALDHLHKHNIVHRDIKPSNLLLRVDVSGIGNLILSDFGEAHHFGDGEVIPRGHRGTRCYESPECLLDQFNAETIHLSDIWAAGCVIVQLLTGRTDPVFVPGAAIETLSSIFNLLGSNLQTFLTQQERKASALHDALSHVSEEARDVVLGMLRLNARERLDASALLTMRWFQTKQTLNIPSLLCQSLQQKHPEGREIAFLSLSPVASFPPSGSNSEFRSPIVVPKRSRFSGLLSDTRADLLLTATHDSHCDPTLATWYQFGTPQRLLFADSEDNESL